MSQSILFEETKKPKKKIKSCNNLSKLQKSGFSTSNEFDSTTSSIQSTDLFAPSASPAPKAPKAKKHTTVEADSNPETALQSFYIEEPALKRYVSLQLFYDSELNEKQAKQKIVNLAKKHQLKLSNSYDKIRRKLIAYYDQRQEIINNKQSYVTKELPSGASFYVHSLVSLQFYSELKDIRYKVKHIQRLNGLVLYIGKILEMVINSPQDKEAKFDQIALDRDIEDLSAEKKIIRNRKLKKHLKQLIKKSHVTVDVNLVTTNCQKLFREQDNFFTDFGLTESLFETVIDQMALAQIDYINRCIRECLSRPEISGKLIYDCASNFLTVHELNQDTMPFYFILFVRYFFSHMFLYKEPVKLDSPSEKKSMTKVSSFDLLKDSVPPKLMKGKSDPQNNYAKNAVVDDLLTVNHHVQLVQGLGTLSPEALEIQVTRVDCTAFINKVKILLQHSPFELGLTENFLPPKYKTIALAAFPKETNPYNEAIDVFSELPYYFSPIDFCRRMHEGLKIVQRIASDISFNEKQQATGKIYAKSDHLLCLDDLFDVTLITILISNPVPIYQLVETFQPFIDGLQMISELEFAFTNIHAIMKHIDQLDIDKFSKDAKLRVEEEMEIDPLHIISSKK